MKSVLEETRNSHKIKMDHMMMQFSFKGQTLFPDANNNGKRGSRDGSKNAEKYQLRPRGRAREGRNVNRQNSDNKQTPVRPKPAPLSKYRRKTANARERSRMREINQAFEALRRCVPHWAASPCTPQGEKLTKITTLRLAMRYIGSLTAALQEPPLYHQHEFDILDSDESRTTCSPHTMRSSDSSLSPDMMLPDSPFLSSPESYSPMLTTTADLQDHCLSPLDFDSPSLLHEALTDSSLKETFSDYFLT